MSSAMQGCTQVCFYICLCISFLLCAGDALADICIIRATKINRIARNCLFICHLHDIATFVGTYLPSLLTERLLIVNRPNFSYRLTSSSVHREVRYRMKANLKPCSGVQVFIEACHVLARLSILLFFLIEMLKLESQVSVP
uniref:Secreted protein n=1 Tax=Rhipicephalus appendiculatus TaxID=34631 RepID=A0A131YGF6_RHIAP